MAKAQKPSQSQEDVEATLALEALDAAASGDNASVPPPTAYLPDYVVVCCKLPSGLSIPVPGTDIVVKLNGFHSAYALFNHGRTTVPRRDWDAIETYYATHPGAKWLHSGLVFAERDANEAVAHARDQQNVEGGFEPVDPANLPKEGVNGRIQDRE